MSLMFYDAMSFVSDLSHWDVSGVRTMQQMFTLASSYNVDLSEWDVSGVGDVSKMFYVARDFNQNLCPWGRKLKDTALVLDMFKLTNCPNKTNPILGSTPPGPFFYVCTNIQHPNL